MTAAVCRVVKCHIKYSMGGILGGILVHYAIPYSTCRPFCAWGILGKPLAEHHRLNRSLPCPHLRHHLLVQPSSPLSLLLEFIAQKVSISHFSCCRSCRNSPRRRCRGS